MPAWGCSLRCMLHIYIYCFGVCREFEQTLQFERTEIRTQSSNKSRCFYHGSNCVQRYDFVLMKFSSNEIVTLNTVRTARSVRRLCSKCNEGVEKAAVRTLPVFCHLHIITIFSACYALKKGIASLSIYLCFLIPFY